MNCIIALILLFLCVICLAYINAKEKWDNNTRPPKGWTQHKGVRTKFQNLEHKMQELNVGSLVTLKTSCWFGWDGIIGFVYETYERSDPNDKTGVSIIFENGFYDGFSETEQNDILVKIGFLESLSDYKFKGVMHLTTDLDKIKKEIDNYKSMRI